MKKTTQSQVYVRFLPSRFVIVVVVVVVVVVVHETRRESTKRCVTRSRLVPSALRARAFIEGFFSHPKLARRFVTRPIGSIT
jgi:hypothetical protein